MSYYLFLKHHVMVDFMCQLGWTTVPRYLLKHYSGCFYEGVFLEKINT